MYGIIFFIINFNLNFDCIFKDKLDRPLMANSWEIVHSGSKYLSAGTKFSLHEKDNTYIKFVVIII